MATLYAAKEKWECNFEAPTPPAHFQTLTKDLFDLLMTEIAGVKFMHEIFGLFSNDYVYEYSSFKAGIYEFVFSKPGDSKKH